MLCVLDSEEREYRRGVSVAGQFSGALMPGWISETDWVDRYPQLIEILMLYLTPSPCLETLLPPNLPHPLTRPQSSSHLPKKVATPVVNITKSSPSNVPESSTVLIPLPTAKAAPRPFYTCKQTNTSEKSTTTAPTQNPHQNPSKTTLTRYHALYPQPQPRPFTSLLQTKHTAPPPPSTVETTPSTPKCKRKPRFNNPPLSPSYYESNIAALHTIPTRSPSHLIPR